MGAQRGLLTFALLAIVLLSRPPALPAATPPAGFALLVPGDRTVTHASLFGSTPMMAWEASSDVVSHYEIWIDGVRTDTVPARTHGHLPGARHGNYTPFRPYGFLAGQEVCYYTPQVSKFTPGPHRWHVTAVDNDGNKRRSDREGTFTVEDPGTTRIFVNHLGYPAAGLHRIVVDGSVATSTFEVVDEAGKSVASGDLKNAGDALGSFLHGDFSTRGLSGTYRIKAGTEHSMWFPVGPGARLNYEDCLRKYRHAYIRKRCGNTTANWGGKACHLDDARMDDGARHAIVGGWHASSDVRKIMRILQPALHGLVEMKRIADPAWDNGEYSILDEIKWGNRYIHEMQLESGAVVQHYYLWCGATDWSETINRYTNNVIGDADDRLLPEDTLLIDMVSQSRFIQNQTAIHHLYREVDPGYAARCLKAAARCYEHFTKTWPVVTDYATTFNARPYEETVTDLMPLAYGVRANLSMHLATGDPVCRDRAVTLADQLMALQETEYVGDQEVVKGFFYGNPGKDAIFDSYMAHGGLDGAPGAVVVLADLCDALPTHPNRPRWKECLRSYLEDYLLPLSDRNAFGIVPGYLSRTPLAGGKRVGDLHYRYLDDNRGVNKFLVRKAVLLARGGRILGNPGLRDAAWRQLDWILGCNPMNSSTVYGVGHNQPKLYKAHLAPRSDGMVVQGIGGDAEDRPWIRQGHWRHCEMELHHTAWFAQALFELLSQAGNETTEATPATR